MAAKKKAKKKTGGKKSARSSSRGGFAYRNVDDPYAPPPRPVKRSIKKG